MLIGVTGAAQAGKDSVANMLVANYGYTKLAFADGVREMAAAIDPYVDMGADRHYTAGNSPFARYSELLATVGYEKAKQAPDVRRLLQRIGTEAVRDVFGKDAWVKRIAGIIEGATADIVISDVRFPNEAAFIRANGGVVVRVLRPGHDNGLPATHASEAQVAGLDVDAELEATNLDELRASLSLFMASLPGFMRTLREIRQHEFELDVQPSSVYLAAPWAFKAEATAAKAALVAAGVNVISGWTERENTPAEIDATTMAEQARLDRDEVREADALVILNLAKSDGKASEMGMALALGKRVILVGGREGNIFYHLPEVERVDTLAEASALLGYEMLEADGSAVEGAENTTQPAEPDIIRLIDVRRVGDDVVEVSTGQIIATKLGVVSSDDENVQQ